jgi:carnitine-CoA ligase
MSGNSDTINAAFARALAAAPDRVFVDCEGEQLTYAQADALIMRYAHGLAALGVGQGDPVALMLDNHVTNVALWLAANRLGAISAPVNTAFRGPFLAGQLADCSAAVVIAEDDYAERIRAVASDLPDMRHLVPMAEVSKLLSDDTTPIPDLSRPSDTALLVYTSGTTGAAKGCMISHNQACSLPRALNEANPLAPEAVIWTPLPLFHMYALSGTTVRAMLAQCRASLAKRFSVSGFWPEIERSGATVVNLLGSMAALVAGAADTAEAERCRGQIKAFNAAPMNPATALILQERFGIAAGASGGYGMTEAAPIAGRLPTDPPGPPHSCGRTGVYFDIQIVDEDDNELPRGEVGEIVCRPRLPNIMFKGYWNRPDDTIRAWRNLWFHTGDLGRLDEAGWLYFADRKKDYLRRRGENISSLEMEAVFRQHPAIRDVAVHAVPSPLGEDDVKVTAELAEPGGVSEHDLCLWSAERVPYYAVPLYIEFREELPRTASGKVRKDILRDEGRTGQTWCREDAGVTLKRR